MSHEKEVGVFGDEFQTVIEFDKHSEGSLSTHGTVNRDLASYSTEIQSEVMRRYRFIEWIRKRVKGGWTEKNLNSLIRQAAIELKLEPPSCRTLARWWKRYSEANFSLMSLLPNNSNKGNRKQKVANDSVFFERAIERYLVPERPSIAAVYEYYSDLIRIENQSLVDGKIKPVSYKGFYNRVKKLPAYEVVLARHGKYQADMEFNKIDAHMPPSRVLEKVEIDHTPLDLILLDDELKLPIGRPYLTLLIDQYSKSIIGFHLGYNQPSYYSVMKAILNAIKPKDYVKERYPSIEHDWYCQGKMETLVVDNGPEFWGGSLEQACLEVGINIQFNPVRKPWLKALVERIFRTISSKLLVNIPGKTFSNIMERAGYDPTKDSVMTFSVFDELFHKWVIDVYHYETDTRKRLIPHLKWQEGVSMMPPISYQPEDLEKLSVILGLQAFRKHRRGGIHLHGLRYDSQDFAAYRRMNPRDTVILTKTDPDDISSIYVYLERERHYLKVPCIDPIGYTKGLSLDNHLKFKLLYRDYISRHTDLDGLAKARIYIHERIVRETEELNQLHRSRPKRTTGGMARLAKHNGVRSDSDASCVPEALPALNVKEQKNPQKALPDSDEWDDFISKLDPY
ncbi:Mu transposase C-terminal domain-containing protein [Photobacterium galatheae]|uniref:Integrase n=1 Tax=Photobacterium galatheae TaxID=1654360 RepID=A0A066RZM7_9GAMM|nr:Mu transposase C-terminal domain-containing protein [Photobacterium galatheae]KDM93137.1 integrase [Photobacterium galatheae]MCM0148335.1 transposase [Photobacterium galatheae]